MQGFYITISNGLLEGEHRKRMGSSVWEFMWLLDKMTSISEQGIGTVLGGRPIKISEIAKDTQVARKTVGENLDKLSIEGYINIIRAPYGLVITVNKAQKTFGQKKQRDITKTTHQETKKRYNQNDTSLGENDTSLGENDTSNIRQDNRQDTLATDVANGKRFNTLLCEFKNINPNYEKFLNNKTERLALQELVDKYGFNKMENLLKMLPEIVSTPYAPRITTPVYLQKMGDLIIFMKQNQRKGGVNGNGYNKRSVDARHL